MVLTLPEMKKSIIVVAMVTGFCLTVNSCSGDKAEKTNTDSAVNTTTPVSENGKSIFDANCIVCHGDDGMAGVMGAADLSKSTINHLTVISIIKSGKNAMRAFGSELNESQLEMVATYAESLRK
ncbi:hypothetical protein BH09BAC5_BH09BAC5_29430 [soil metagenome]